MDHELLHDLSYVIILNIMICMELIKLDVIDLACLASIDLIYFSSCRFISILMKLIDWHLAPQLEPISVHTNSWSRAGVILVFNDHRIQLGMCL